MQLHSSALTDGCLSEMRQSEAGCHTPDIGVASVGDVLSGQWFGIIHSAHENESTLLLPPLHNGNHFHFLTGLAAPGREENFDDPWSAMLRETTHTRASLRSHPVIHNIVSSIGNIILPHPDKESIAEICEVVQSFADYPDGWDGDGSIAPPRAEVDNAVAFLQKIPFRVLQPKAMIAGDGDVGFTWRRGDDYLEVGFLDGNMSFCCQKDGKWKNGDFSRAGGEMPGILLEAILDVAGVR